MSPSEYDRACAEAEIVDEKAGDWYGRLMNPAGLSDIESAFELAIERVFTEDQMKKIAVFIVRTCGLEAEFRTEARRLAEREVYGTKACRTAEDTAWDGVK